MCKPRVNSAPTAGLLAIVGALIVTGCSTLAPEYTRSEPPVSNEWKNQLDTNFQGLSTEPAAHVPWKKFIKDERLVQLIELALKSNRSLRQTLADVEAARATYRIQRAELFPNISIGLEKYRSRTEGETSSSYQAELGLSSYEIDLFGKNRSLTTSEIEAYLASAETAKAAQITLISEIASAWLTLAADRSLLQLAQETAENAEKNLAITRQRQALGVDSRSDVASAETIYQSARSDIASYTTQVNQDLNALRLLVGDYFDDSLLADTLPESEKLVTDVPAGLASEVLLERPDVLAAEHKLKSANADIGAARAAFFPSLSLTTTGGVASAALSDLFTSGASSIWTFAPSLTLPIFYGGANRANLAYTKAQQKKYLAAYEYAVQSAFSEVADALARRATIQDQIKAEEALVAAATRNYELSMARYKSGIENFQTVLEAQRIMYSAQTSLISTRQADLENRITLYRTLGGGLGVET